MSRIKLTLLDNCHSFLTEAIKHAVEAENNIHQWKYAILFLVQSIELALKERLRCEHYALIYKNIDKMDNTVTIEQAARRLNEIVKIKISNEDISALKTAIMWRNQIVHYEFDFSVEEMKTVFAKLFGFLQAFHDSHLGKCLYDMVEESLWSEVLSIKSFAEELYNKAKLKLETENIDYNLTWTCNRCGWDMFVFEDGINKCYLCGYEDFVVFCEDCDEPIYENDAKEYEYGNRKGLDFKKKLCAACYNKRMEIYYHDDEF